MVAVQNPYKPAQIVSMEYVNTKKCSLYQDDFWEWSHERRLKKTWSNFEAHFARVFKEIRRSSRTSKTKGYAANVKSSRINAALLTNMQQDHIMALENLTTTTEAQKTLVTLLTKMIA